MIKLENASAALTDASAVPYLFSGTDLVMTERMAAMGSGTHIPAMHAKYRASPDVERPVSTKTRIWLSSPTMIKM